MEDQLLKALEEAGLDVRETLRRFMNKDALYRKFLLKFTEDDTFEKIKPAMDERDMENALIAVHTLKGVTGNLGLKRLYRACVNTVNLIRQEEVENAIDSYQELKDAYEEICRIIKTYGER